MNNARKLIAVGAVLLLMLIAVSLGADGPMVGTARVAKSNATVVQLTNVAGVYRWTNSSSGNATFEMQCTMEGTSDRAEFTIQRSGVQDMVLATQNGENMTRVVSLRLNPGVIVVVTNSSTGAGASATLDKIIIYEE